jgi:phage gp16-like protein
MKAGAVRLKNGAIMRRLHDVCFDLALNDLALAHGMAALEILTDDYELYERVQLLKLLQKHPSGLAGREQADKDTARPTGRFFKGLGAGSGRT